MEKIYLFQTLEKYVICFTCIIIDIRYIYRLIQGKGMADKVREHSPIIPKYRSLADKIIQICWTAIVLLGTIFCVVKPVMDIPSLVTGNYSYVEGTVIDGIAKRKGQKTVDRGEFTVADRDTGENIKLHVESYGIEEGRYLMAWYLPYTKDVVRYLYE